MKPLSKFLACSLLAMLSFAAWAQEQNSESRPVDAQVTRIVLSGKITAHISRADTPQLTLTSKSDALSRVTTTQSGDTLVVAAEDHIFVFGRSKDVELNLNLPQLVEISASSLGDCEVSGFSGSDLKLRFSGVGNMSADVSYQNVSLNLSGLGDMKIDLHDSEKVEASLSGTGHIVLSGNTRFLKASVSGLGSLDADKLMAIRAVLSQSGVGNASLNVTEDAEVNSSGLGTVTVYGQPEKRQYKSGGLSKIIWK
jgi:hypothetical protein